MITLYQYELSPFCNKVMLILNYKNIDYSIINMSVAKSRRVREFSATAKLPCIDHQGQYINDSTDIAHYLEQHFPEPGLIPTDSKLQSLCHVYEDWADESLNFYMMTLRWLPQNRQRWSQELGKYDSGIVRWLIQKFAHRATLDILDKQGVGRKSEEQILKDIHRHLASIDSAIESSEYILGDTISLADISIYTQLYWMNKNPEGELAIARYPNLIKWMGRVKTLTLDNRI